MWSSFLYKNEPKTWALILCAFPAMWMIDLPTQMCHGFPNAGKTSVNPSVINVLLYIVRENKTIVIIKMNTVWIKLFIVQWKLVIMRSLESRNRKFSFPYTCTCISSVESQKGVANVPLRTRRALLLYTDYACGAFWFSMEYHWTALMPFWLPSNDIG